MESCVSAGAPREKKQKGVGERMVKGSQSRKSLEMSGIGVLAQRPARSWDEENQE